ncbi:hypothetical protein WH47_09293 [Habropoda laboriosa]|uniref:Uncharacterized protein n=1 Tax=Habropoda laboriosa TaxID=597456 RepID=A0A0L7R9E5_9HYME|nr:hypothetical protein WH47_09293 [Habropoda laboriosa]
MTRVASKVMTHLSSSFVSQRGGDKRVTEGGNHRCRCYPKLIYRDNAVEEYPESHDQRDPMWILSLKLTSIARKRTEPQSIDLDQGLHQSWCMIQMLPVETSSLQSGLTIRCEKPEEESLTAEADIGWEIVPMVEEHPSAIKDKKYNAKRGLGSLARKHERFTERKNIEGKAYVKERIRKECLELGVNLDMSEEVFLKTLVIGEEVNRPPLEVAVSIDVVPELARSTLEYLASQKVEIRDEDQVMSEQVATLQVRAKVAKARATTPVDSQPINDPYVDKTVKLLTQVTKSVEQVGVAEHQKQTFAPSCQKGK